VSLLFYGIAIIILITAERFFNEPLFQLTIEVVPSIQAHLNFPAILYLKFMTLFGYGHMAIVFFAIAFAFSTREKAFYLLFVHTWAGILN